MISSSIHVLTQARRRLFIRYFTPLMVAVVLTGCGSGEEQFVPVAGQVTIDGKPLSSGIVTFVPQSGQGNKSWHRPIGVIDQDGKFALTTINKPGAPLGWYKVLVHADENQQTGVTRAPIPPRWKTHIRYTTENATPLKVEVIEVAEPGRYDLRLKK